MVPGMGPLKGDPNLGPWTHTLRDGWDPRVPIQPEGDGFRSRKHDGPKGGLLVTKPQRSLFRVAD